jgi:hypothetical protein
VIYWLLSLWRKYRIRRCECCRQLGRGREYAQTIWGCGIMCDECVTEAMKDFYGSYYR